VGSNLNSHGGNLVTLAGNYLQAGLPQCLEDTDLPALVHDGSRLKYVNAALAEWLHYERGELNGCSLAVLTGRDDLRGLKAAVGASEGPPPASSHVQRFVTRHGEPALGQVLARRGKVAGASATLVLIEPSLGFGVGSTTQANLLTLLAQAVDHLSDIVFITEADSIDGVGRRIVFVNRAFTQVTGFEARDVLGKTPNITVGEDTDRATLSRIEEGLKEQKPVHEELLKYGKDGVEYWVELDIIPVLDEHGRHSHWVSVQRDISERKRLEKRLLETAQLASAGQLAAQLASELNNPLAAVASCIEWLSVQLPLLVQKVEKLDPALKGEVQEIREALGDAITGTARLGAATSYLRLLGGTAPAPRQCVALEAVVETALEQALLETKLWGQVRRTYKGQPHIIAEPGRLGQGLRLVLRNALQALAPEQAAKNFVTVHIAEENSNAVLEVCDTGSGVPKELVDRLFTPFATSRPPGFGTGLGLFIAERLVRELDGDIAIKPNPEGGTLVTIRLPLAGNVPRPD
jgi:PAS domain S-box-containing protein